MPLAELTDVVAGAPASVYEAPTDSLRQLEGFLGAATCVAGRQPACGSAEWDDHLYRFSRSEDIARAILSTCGVSHPPPCGVPFPSPLPLEGEAESRLWRGPKHGEILLVDRRLADEDGDPQTITLGDAHASYKRGNLLQSAGFTAAVFAQRALVEAGLLVAASVALPPLPPGEPPKVVRFHETIQELFNIRWMRALKPVPLTRGFVNDYSGQCEKAATYSRKRHVELGIIHEADKHGEGFRSYDLYNPGPCPTPGHARLWRSDETKQRWTCAHCESAPSGQVEHFNLSNVIPLVS